MVLAFSLGEFSMGKRHNLRQQKKLHLGPFRELGCYLEVTLNEGVDDQAANRLVMAFIEEVVEPRGLIYGGTLGFGYLCTAAPGNVSEDDRAAMAAWLAARSEVASYTVGELVDAWR